MKIQKGMVKYKDRNDIICMYGVNDDGKTYYFLDSSDGKTFSNGNRVVSTELVEAIDPMVKSSNVGVIDSEGNEVIKCENKAIKLVSDSVVLVEKASPVTESVISAIGYRSDPLYAAKLVSTPAQIKDNIYREMGNDGRFLFNDQFAEATVCDIDGNNLVNDEVYSFVAMNNNHLYLSKNTPDSSVVHFALGENKVEEDVSSESVQKVKEEVTTSEIVGESSTDSLEHTDDESKIDVSEIKVPIDVVEGALDGETSAQDSNVIQDNFEIDSSTPIENVNEGLVAPSADEFLAASSVGAVNNEDDVMDDFSENVAVNADNQASSQSENSSETIATSNEFVNDETETTEVPSEEVSSDATENNENVEAVPVTDEFVIEGTETAEVSSEEVASDTTENNENVETVPVTDEFVSEGTETTEISSEEVASDTTKNNENVETVPVTDEFVSEGTETTEVSSEEVETPLNEKDIQSLLDETSTDLFNGSSLKVDTIVDDGFTKDELDSYALDLQKIDEESENFLGDVAKSMTGLIRQNREQRATISNYEEVIKGLNSSKDELQNKTANLEKENVELNDRNRSLENAVVKLKSRVEMLASKLQEKEEKISTQSHELQLMRHQLEGRDQLLDLLKDAKALIGEDKANDEEYGYSKVA